MQTENTAGKTHDFSQVGIHLGFYTCYLPYALFTYEETFVQNVGILKTVMWNWQ